MKKSFAMLILAFSLALTFSACNSSTTPKTGVESTVSEMAVYTCTMHPEVQKDKPGDCPVCGMALVKKEASDTTHMHDHSDTMHMH
ncbi:MAG: hypothetical protein IPN08_15835 [Bacteroidales bacterium]|jgi:hypothetical protein|nr:hypothetical protein [Bacteroidales bacterium]MBK9358828.1 hypothetical protein [Bacteroidales bacterium]MBP9882732.1 hypothetical protein [Chitinophagales bacterium]